MSRFFEALVAGDQHTLIEGAGKFFRQTTEQSKFLTYDVGTLLEWYRDETPVFGLLPYSELDCFLDQEPDPRVDKMDAPFQLASHPLQDSAYEAFVGEKRIDAFDSENVRLEQYDTCERRFVVRQCRYSDGVKSNYTMDWQGKLRSMMRQDYGSRLPPLDEPRLANSLGLAVIIWYRLPDGDVLPYLPRRVAGLAVFPGGRFHCTASGNAEWITGAATFDQMFTGEICRELSEEVGLSARISSGSFQWRCAANFCEAANRSYFLRGLLMPARRSSPTNGDRPLHGK